MQLLLCALPGAYSSVAHTSSCGTTDNGLPGGGRTARHAIFAQARARCRLRAKEEKGLNRQGSAA